MGEKTGFMFVLLIFSITLLPFLLNTFEKQTHSSKLLTLTTEVQQMVSAEGGVTNKVKDLTSAVREKDVFIEYFDTQGSPITGKVDVGEEIIIKYEYRGFKTENSVVILRR